MDPPVTLFLFIIFIMHAEVPEMKKALLKAPFFFRERLIW